MTTEHWDAAYRGRPSAGSSWWQDAADLWLDVLADAGPTSRVVDVGAGASLLADVLLARGIGHLTLVDLSDEALSAVRGRLGERDDADEVDYVVADVRGFTAEPQVDVWHDRAVLHFLVDPDDRAAYKASLLRSVRAGGTAVIAGFAEDGPEQCSGLPVVRASVDELAEFVAPEFVVTRALRREHRTPWGAVQPFSVIVARRA